MSAQKFVVLVEKDGEGVRIEVITPDGEVEPLGIINNPAQVLPFAVQFAPMMSSMVTQAIYEARG